MNVLSVTSHPDDLELGAGSSIAKLAEEGNKVYSLILAEPNYGGRIQAEDPRIIKSQCFDAAAILGIEETEFADFPDNRFDTVAFLDIVKVIEKYKEMVKPEIVFCHTGMCLNIDHQITHRAVITACRPLKDEKVRSIYGMEILSSSEWLYGSERFKPNAYFPLTKEQVDKKLRAMSCYKSELREFPHPRSELGIECLLRLRGSECGVEWSEAFEIIRSVE